MLSLGLDLGGAHTKAVLLREEGVEASLLRYLPLWKEREGLNSLLKELKGWGPERVGAVMTGELADVFGTREEGVKELAGEVWKVWRGKALFLTLGGELVGMREVLSNPLSVAASNWVASGLVVAEEFPDSLLVDVGSTTTDLVPLVDGKVANLGSTDFQRLRRGELVYTGVVRTPVPCVLGEVEGAGVAAENFAVMGDVYILLGKLRPEEYTSETPDGRGKDPESCRRRLARTFCSDPEEVGEGFLRRCARSLHREQVRKVAEKMRRVTERYGLEGCPAVLTGVGRRILGREAAGRSGFKRVVDLGRIWGEEAALMTP
ncbi:MAG: hydantoinase/oxoprolinase family protein, partial [Candidatus Hadarchaeales archaeon]